MFGPSSILLVFLGCALALTVPSRSLDVITTARLAFPHLAAEAKQFGEFAVEHKRNYKTRDEILTRFSLFVENLEKIKRQNEEAKGVTIYGITEFTDWSWPEFRAKMLITGKPEFNMTNFPRRSVPQNRDHPENWDWRVSGIVTGVKNQGGCGSCWAFATAAVVESMNAKAGRGLVELAEQQMVDCIEGGCQGGVLAHSFGYAQDHGLPTEGDYPYRGEKGDCHDANIAAKLSQMYILPNDEESIAYSITDGGPAALGFKVGEAWMNYKGGVITSTDCDNENPEKWHANEAIGYGVEGGTPYWLLKNSWGTGWGDGGFVKVRRGSNWCQITSMPVGGGIW